MEKRITESDSHYDSLERMSTEELLRNINREDKTVAHSVEKQLSAIVNLADAVYEKMKLGGRLFLYWSRHQWKIGHCRCI